MKDDWIKAWLHEMTQGGRTEIGVRLEKAYVDDKGERHIFNVWLSISEAKELAETLPLLLRGK